VKEGIAERARTQSVEGVDQRSNPYRDLSKEESIDALPPVSRSRASESRARRSNQIRRHRLRPQERSHSEIEDLVLLRSDGQPLYNLSVVIDDISMGITHVIRGQDHLTNTHKQILLYEALGATVPQFAHLPLILAPNKGKLSKRKHGEVVSLTTYRDRGFVPAAFRNFLALLGGPRPTEKKCSAKRS
jgi:glutamyl-tRNA synthetase